MEWLIRETRYFLKLRENSRFYHILGFGLVRRKIIEAERILLEQGRLRCKDDIFYLEWVEVVALKTRLISWRDVEERIRTRRLRHIRLAKQGPVQSFGFDVESETTTDADGICLQGQTASTGSHQGRARVILRFWWRRLPILPGRPCFLLPTRRLWRLAVICRTPVRLHANTVCLVLSM